MSTVRIGRLLFTMMAFLAAAPAGAAKPLPCPDGRFVVLQADGQLIVGTDTRDEVVVKKSAGQISIDSGCAADQVKKLTVTGTKRVTKVNALWTTCGDKQHVTLVATISLASGCKEMKGTRRARKSPKKSFTAIRSSCGDGFFDKGNDEECDGSNCADGQACQADCRCPAILPTTTTTTSTSTTTPLCPNGHKDPGEECDGTDFGGQTCPGGSAGGGFLKCTAACKLDFSMCGSVVTTCDTPGHQGTCPTGKICGCSGVCEDPQPCACGATAPTQWKFVTASGTGVCGASRDAAGTTLSSLGCGDLFFGGGSVLIPLPATIPDQGTTIANVSLCSGSCLGLSKATQADTGSPLTCSSKDCFFGVPLPVPNVQQDFISTCILNVVAADATGSATCDDGGAKVSLPLASKLYITGDLLPQFDFGTGMQDHCTGGTNDGAVCTTNADCPNGPNPNGPNPNGLCSVGIQPCPICTGPQGAATCHGGVNEGGTCTPGTSALGARYPTSHDCPPPDVDLQCGTGHACVGALAIPFVLSTGTPSLTSAREVDQDHMFCGFCRDSAFPDQSFAFANPPVPCKVSADCAGVVGAGGITYERCAQKESGCFNSPDCNSITENGMAAGSLTDHASHNITLATVFCIPPSFSPLVDPSAGLPGPGATALQGTVQLLP